VNLKKNEIIDHEDHVYGSDSNSEDFKEVNNDQYSSLKLIDDSCFISLELNDFFESCLPKLVKGCKRVLLYRYFFFIFVYWIIFCLSIEILIHSFNVG